jgi:S-adenosylmethionine hydrolase
MSAPATFTPNGIVTFTTDFGTRDAYVGAMKGVVLTIAPQLRIHDVAHDVEPQNVAHGGTVLRGACPWFPAGTVHLAVIDPGVGTARAPVVVLAGGHAFVGPDNGLFAAVAARLGGAHAAYRIDPTGVLARHLPARPATTFAGRDLFAPVAALLAAGVIEPQAVGAAHVLTPPPAPAAAQRSGDAIAGELAYHDHFGNAITTITVEDVHTLGDGRLVVRLPDEQRIAVHATYGDAAPGALLALIGSEGFVEIAVRDGSAQTRLGLAIGTTIRVERERA